MTDQSRRRHPNSANSQFHRTTQAPTLADSSNPIVAPLTNANGTPRLDHPAMLSTVPASSQFWWGRCMGIPRKHPEPAPPCPIDFCSQYSHFPTSILALAVFACGSVRRGRRPPPGECWCTHRRRLRELPAGSGCYSHLWRPRREQQAKVGGTEARAAAPMRAARVSRPPARRTIVFFLVLGHFGGKSGTQCGRGNGCGLGNEGGAGGD
jgi:hypothetical protein